jgi:hypothetical protein
MSTLPPATPPPAAGVAPLPWEARGSRGIFQSFLDTWGLFLSRPQEAWNRTRESGDLGSPLIFGVVICWIALLLQRAISSLIARPVLPMLPGMLGRRFPWMERLPMGRPGAAGLIVHAVVSPIFIFIGLFIGAAVLHVCCMIVGALTNSRAGFEGTFRVVSYSEAAYIAAVVPVVGGLIALVWWIILLVTTATDRLHQGMHDRWAGSVVVQPAPGGSGAAVVGCLVLIALALFVPFIAFLLVSDDLRDILSRVGTSI